MGRTNGSGRQHTIIYVDDGKQCIFRVPKVLQKQNPDAYTPCVVSIGPFHHRRKGSKDEVKDHKEEGKEGKEDEGKDFQLVERMKERYLNEVLSCTGIATLEELTAKVIEISDKNNEGLDEFEKHARGFYAEPLDQYEPQYFNKMMILDGCFLIQLFRKRGEKRGSYDPLFDMNCMFHFLCHDLLLLENQLPWFVLDLLYSLILDNSPGPNLPLSILILNAFKHLPSLQHCDSYKHLLLHSQEPDKQSHDLVNVLHILDLLRHSIVAPIEKRADEQAIHDPEVLDPDLPEMYTATALSKAGITFQSFKTDKTHKSIMEIDFKEGSLICNGVLKIPQLNIGMQSESLFRNLIAFEQCYSGISNEITSYAVFMDNLIETQQDMELLCKAKVIGNWLSDEEGCEFFNNLYKGIPYTRLYYGPLCKRVQQRYKIKWYTYVSSFKTEKLSNPWAVIAFCTAIVLLVLQVWNTTNSLRTFRKANNGF